MRSETADPAIPVQYSRRIYPCPGTEQVKFAANEDGSWLVDVVVRPFMVTVYADPSTIGADVVSVTLVLFTESATADRLPPDKTYRDNVPAVAAFSGSVKKSSMCVESELMMETRPGCWPRMPAVSRLS